MSEGFWTIAPHCECCHTRGAQKRVGTHNGQKVTAVLCDTCTTQNHSMAVCLVGPNGVLTEPVCHAKVWNCAEYEHVRQKHPEALSYRERQPEDKPKKSNLTYLGTLDVNKLLEGE